ncbi:non-ribosomal peptide synthetase [Streptomyces melanosporofaciens]|uniref:Amino acid adenylation domain-containing protein n=1 Tax=Streptomyces melanosporofaciens TaxID=67327 RepID=A0A1H5BGI2_STRMJ|nr:non-ribosomal peptide synthetase [Streptomyces melanosporofaciens]SED53358.1 amino acid adenylation domain-containing protein [Streptomyces melanosporofaciens]
MTAAADPPGHGRPAHTHDLVRDAARRWPDRPALIEGDTVLTHRQLDRRAEDLARALVARGAGGDMTIGVGVPRSAEHVIAALAVWKAGGVYVPLATDLPPARIADMLGVAGVRLTVGPGLTISEVADPPVDRPLAGLPPAPEGEDGAVACVYFTSGSTGRPKAVALTHAGIVNEALWSHDAFSIRPEDRSGWLASPGFAISRWELWTPLTAGAAIAVSEEGAVREPGALRDWLLDQGVTWSIVVTGLAERLFGVPWPADCPLRLLVTGGEQLRVWPRGLPFEVVNSYGVTEASSVRLAARLDPLEGSTGGLPSVGRPIRGTRVHVLDDALAPVPDGEVGELFIGGVGLARGYLGDPEQTARRFVPDPFHGGGRRLYRTGDLVRVDEKGRVEFVRRLNDDPKVNGVRVDLAAVEAALLASPGVTGAAAAIRVHDGERPRLVGYLVVDDDRSAADEVIDAVARRLPPQMVPGVLVRLSSLPLLSSGKVDRGRLPEPTADIVFRGRPATARDETEQQVIDVFREVLGRADIGAHDDFFGLGGDSMGVARVRQSLLERHGIDVPYTLIFRQRTPRRICTAASDGGEEPR